MFWMTWFTHNLPSPLAGEGQGGGEQAFHASTEARSWPLRSRVRCVAISPMPSGGSGLGSAGGNSTDAASDDRHRSVRTSWTSRAWQRASSLRWMEANTAGGPKKMLCVGLGSRPMDSTSYASGITRCLATWRECWRRSGGPCRIERQIHPRPRPSPARGEGDYLVARSCKGGDCLTSATGRDEVARLGLLPGRRLGGKTWWPGRNTVSFLLPERGGRDPASAGASGV
jgi:hypothetical protein